MLKHTLLSTYIIEIHNLLLHLTVNIDKEMSAGVGVKSGSLCCLSHLRKWIFEW